MKRYIIIGWLASVAVPIAAVIAFGWRVYASTLKETGLTWLAILAGVATAVGLEFVGMMAGAAGLHYFRKRNYILLGVSAVILSVYVIVGLVELSGSISATVFIIAPLVYILVAMIEEIEKEKAGETAVSQFEQDEKEKDNAHKRELALIRQADNKDVRLAKVSQDFAERSQSVRRATNNGDYSSTKVKQYECPDCDYTTNNSRSYNAHRRHCKNKVTAVNGQGVLR